MKKLVLSTLFFVYLSLITVGDSFTNDINRADSLYNSRNLPGHLLNCYSELSSINLSLLTKEQQLEVYWRLARVATQVPIYINASKQKKLELVNKGVEAGEHAKQIAPTNINMIYWHAVALGRQGELKGIRKSLASVKPIKNSMDTILKQDPSFSRAYYVLARLYRKAPKIISIGNTKKALKNINKAVSLDPNESMYLLEKAKILKKMGKKVAAKEVINTLLNLPDNLPNYFPDQIYRDKLASKKLYK